MVDKREKTKTLKEKVAEWLNEEGYPLEFRTANAFRKHRIHTTQGYHVSESAGTPREIDVLAQLDLFREKTLLVRINFVVECKRSKDKPWVLLSSDNTVMAPSAVIAQTIASELGRAALFCMAGEKSLYALKLFQDPVRCAFSGVTAFTSGGQKDPVYSAMQSLISKSVGLAEWYNKNFTLRFPTSAVINFPVIVLEGELYEAYFDRTSSEMVVIEASTVHVHWRGAEHKHISTFDVIKEAELESYVSTRIAEVTSLSEHLIAYIGEIRKCYDSGSLETLNVKPGPRGYTGLPPLLAEIHRKSLSEQEEQKKKSENLPTNEKGTTEKI